MLKLEQIALELFEYKVRDMRARRPVLGGQASVWELYRFLQRQSGLLAPDERRRLELAERTFRNLSGSAERRKGGVTDFSDLVLGESPAADDPPAAPVEPGRPNGNGRQLSEEQMALQRLAAKVWRHEQERFIQRIAGGLRAERDRYTARLLYALHRNLDGYLRSPEAAGDHELARFTVTESIPAHDDPLFSATDMESLAELVRETLDCVLRLSDPRERYSVLGVAAGRELTTMRELGRAVASDPYAGRSGLLEQRGPTAQQLRVAIQELGKERLRDDERRIQRSQLEERLQRVIAFERNQRQVFHQDVELFNNLLEAFFDRLARYLPRSVGGDAGAPRLPGGVLFASNPALRADAIDPRAMSATLRLKGPTRLRLAGIDISLSNPGSQLKLFLYGEERSLQSGSLEVNIDRKWLYAFREGEYLHLKVEDEARSVAVRVAEAAAVAAVLISAQRDELLAVMRTLANVSVGEPQGIVKAALQNMAGLVTRAPDPVAALRGFLQGAARASQVALDEATVTAAAESFQRALSAHGNDLASTLEGAPLGKVSVHTITGEPLAVEVATFNLTIRGYRGSSAAGQDSLVVMLPGQTLGTFEEYLIEELGDGLLVCVRGEQELVVGYLSRSEEHATA